MQIEGIIEKINNWLKSIFKIKSVHPRLATGTIALNIFYISGLIQLATGFPLISKYKLFVCIIAIILVLILYPKYNKKYDPNNNENKMKFAFLMLSLFIFIVLSFLFHKIFR